MSVVIIIGGTGRLKSLIDKSNQLAGENAWTQAQINALAAKFEAWADACQSQCDNPQPPA